MKILVIEDEAIKYIEVQEALEYSGVREPDHVRNQQNTG